MPKPGYDSVVLVTGFPAFLARKLVLHLLASEPRALVLAVVPPALLPEARRVIDPLDRADRERVALLEGDASALDLGLSGVELRQLAREVDLIHHVSHVSYVGVDRPTAETMNMVGAGEIIEVARLFSHLRCLVFHSTAHVSGDRKGAVYEEDLDERASYRSVIEETRARAERIARRAAEELPIAIVRPTMIVGDSGTGEVDRPDLPYLFILLLLAAPSDIVLPIAARGDVPLHFVPVDFVVRASCAIGNDPRSPGRTFHLADPAPLPVRRFVEIVHRLREQRASWMELSTFARSVLRAPGIEGYLRSPKALVDQLLTNVQYDARNADMVLGPLGITCPPLESYAEKLVVTVEERLMGRTGPVSLRPKVAAPEPEPPISPDNETDAMD